MKTADYAGIDYGRGMTNIDQKTGIRFGILPMNNEFLNSWIWESVESVYELSCPDCGKDLPENPEDLDCCPHCEHCFEDYDSSDFYGDEPIGHVFDEDGYEGFVSDQNELWLTKSPYYMHAQFCSPCAPGAGNCDCECEDGPKTYCLGPDFFENGIAPYKCHSVDE